jgi:predicted CXXCH cytochrome family protein
MIRRFNLSCDFIRHSVSALVLLTACAQLPAVQLQQMVTKNGCSKYQDPKTIEPLKKFKHPALEKGCVACHLDCNQLPPGNPQESQDYYYLKAKEPALCLECHAAASKKDLAPAHANQPLGNSKCSGCHDPHSSNIPKRILEFSHGPYKARLCSACHPTPVGGKVQLAAADVDTLCYECHTEFKGEMESTKIRHKLLSQSNRSCIECHDPHAANQENVLKKPVQDLCLGCHVEPSNKTIPGNLALSMPSQEAGHDRNAQYLKLSSKYVHEPVSKSCLLCHDAHGSEFPYELRAPERDLCMDCHGANSEKIVQSSQAFPLFNGLVSLPSKTFEKLSHLELSNKYVHEPASVSCAFCHDAHASDYPMELYSSVQDVCLACHGLNAERILRSEQPVPLLEGKVILPPKVFKALTMINLVNGKFGHPTAKHPVYAPATGDKPELTCVTCHASHSASTGPKLLVNEHDRLCYSVCHEL